MKNKMRLCLVCMGTFICLQLFLFRETILAAATETLMSEDAEKIVEMQGVSQNTAALQQEKEGTQAEVLYEGQDGDLSWSIDTTGHLLISGDGDFRNKEWLMYCEQIKTAAVKVTNMTSASSLFSGCSNLTDVDLSGLDTSRITNMQYMFYDCSSLQELDVSGFNTSLVTNMAGMFGGCNSLQELDVTGFDTGKVTNMNWMFDGCSSLKSLNLSSFDVKVLEECENMFIDCDALVEIRSPRNLRFSIFFPRKSYGTVENWFDQQGNEYAAMVIGKPYSICYSKRQWLKDGNTTVSLEAYYYLSNGKACPNPQVFYKGTLLQEGTDYIRTYENADKAGQGSLIIKGCGKYQGMLKKTYSIRAGFAKVSGVSVTFSHEKGNRKKLNTKTYYKMRIEFDAVEDAKSYCIELSDASGKVIKTVYAKRSALAVSGNNSVSRWIKNLPQSVYGVRVRAEENGTVGEWSGKKYVVKQPKVRARVKGGKIDLKWEKLKNVSGYTVYLKHENNVNYKKTASVGKNTTQKTISRLGKKGLKKGTYYFYVEARKKAGKKTYKSDFNYYGKVVIK